MRNFLRQVKFLVRGSALVRAMSADIDELNQSFSQALHDLHVDWRSRIVPLEEFQRAATDHLQQIQASLNGLETLQIEEFQRAATDHLQQIQASLNGVEVMLALSEASLREVRSEVAGYSETYTAHLLTIQDRLAYRTLHE